MVVTLLMDISQLGYAVAIIGCWLHRGLRVLLGGLQSGQNRCVFNTALLQAQPGRHSLPLGRQPFPLLYDHRFHFEVHARQVAF